MSQLTVTQSTVRAICACTSETGGSNVGGGGYKNYSRSKLLFCGAYLHVA